MHFLGLKSVLLKNRRGVRCPETLRLVGELEIAMRDEFPQDVAAVEEKRLSLLRNKGKYVRVLQKQLLYQKLCREAVRNSYLAATSSKEGGVLRTNWLVKVCLAAPLTTMRGYCEAFTAMFGEYVKATISRGRISPLIRKKPRWGYKCINDGDDWDVTKSNDWEAAPEPGSR